jgi:hypothetical protein
VAAADLAGAERDARRAARGDGLGRGVVVVALDEVQHPAGDQVGDVLAHVLPGQHHVVLPETLQDDRNPMQKPRRPTWCPVVVTIVVFAFVARLARAVAGL